MVDQFGAGIGLFGGSLEHVPEREVEIVEPAAGQKAAGKLAGFGKRYAEAGRWGRPGRGSRR
jgi:hypothetical protein